MEILSEISVLIKKRIQNNQGIIIMKLSVENVDEHTEYTLVLSNTNKIKRFFSEETMIYWVHENQWYLTEYEISCN